MTETSSPTLVFVIVASDDVDTLMRVLIPFSVAGAHGLYVKVWPVPGGKSRIRIEAKGVPFDRAELIKNRILNIASVKRARLSTTHGASKEENEHA